MGASTARITAGEFVTPPEFRGLTLGAPAGGRVGGVRLQLVEHEGATRLGHCYQQAPLRLLPALRLAGEEAALVYLMAITPGLLDGDGHHIEVTAESGTRAIVTGQSALRVHPAIHSFATQQWQVRVESGAVLVLLPGPTIPFRQSRYYQRVVIDLAAGAGLVWGDIWFAGRYARGSLSEQFQFGLIVQDLTVRREGALVFRDRFAWHGPWERDRAVWHFGSAEGLTANCACGSLFLTGQVPEQLLANLPTTGAVFTTADGDTLVRWCGASEMVVNRLVEFALQNAAVLANKSAPRPWLLSGNGLGPNHWFSVERTPA